jgi:hypothetical protein
MLTTILCTGHLLHVISPSGQQKVSHLTQQSQFHPTQEIVCKLMGASLIAVILDNAGYSKGYGFIRFANEEEQKNCLVQMNGYKGLGSKAIKISNAVPKPHRLQPTT